VDGRTKSGHDAHATISNGVTTSPAPKRAFKRASRAAKLGIMRWTILAAALLGFLAVLADAWITHGAPASLDAQAIRWMGLAADFELWHALALLGVGVLMGSRPGRCLGSAAIAFGLGTVLFAGGLDGLALTGAHGFAYVIPVGGTLLLVGWLLLALYALLLRPGR